METVRTRFGRVKAEVTNSLTNMQLAMRKLQNLEPDLDAQIYQDAMYMLGEAVANINELKKRMNTYHL